MVSVVQVYMYIGSSGGIDGRLYGLLTVILKTSCISIYQLIM